MFNDLRIRLRALFHPATMDAELNEELRFHLDNQVAKNLAAGITREEATRQARIVVGGMDQIREEDHEARGPIFWRQRCKTCGMDFGGCANNPVFYYCCTYPLPGYWGEYGCL